MDIGLWNSVLHVVSVLGVLTTGAVIAFTSEYITKLVYVYQNDTLDGYIATVYPLSPVLNGTENEVDCQCVPRPPRRARGVC
jgi:hypothetical protein